MPVDISTAELRTILRAHPGRKRDGSVRTRGEEAVRTIMSATTTHYRRVHGEDSASLGDLAWITADLFGEQSMSSNTQPVREGGAHPDARGTAKRSMEPSGQRRLADNLRSVLMSAAAHISGSPDVPPGEKKTLLATWDTEYRGLTGITVRLERDEHRRILSGQPSKRQLDSWIHWDDFKSMLGPIVQEAIAVLGVPDVAALRTEPARFKKLQTRPMCSSHCTRSCRRCAMTFPASASWRGHPTPRTFARAAARTTSRLPPTGRWSS